MVFKIGASNNPAALKIPLSPPPPNNVSFSHSQMYGALISQDVYNPSSLAQQNTALSIKERFGSRVLPRKTESNGEEHQPVYEFIQEELHEQKPFANVALQQNSLQEFKSRAREFGYNFSPFSCHKQELVRYVVISNVNSQRFVQRTHFNNFLIGSLRRLLLLPDLLGHQFSLKAAPLDENTVIYQETYRNGWQALPLQILHNSELPPVPPPHTEQ